MLNVLRRMPTRKLLILLAGVIFALGSVTAVAVAALGSSGPVPLPKPLSQAIHDALAAQPVQGVTARISFTNNLIDSSSIQGGGPLLKGAKGRLWASADGHIRLELQSERGDTQIMLSPTSFSLYDAASKTAYQGTLPARSADKQGAPKHSVPTVATIQAELTKLMQHANVAGATPTDVGGAAAYSVELSPKHSGGLLGSAQLAWDALHGVPLRAAVYAQGNSSPVLELTASEISFGPVSPSVFAIAPPQGTKIVQVKQPDPKAGTAAKAHRKLTVKDGATAAQAALPFKLSAPDTLAGLPRTNVKLLDFGGKSAALVTYGQHLGAVLVLERALDKAASPATADKPAQPADGGKAALPSVQLGGGVSGKELATALGTLVQFDRGGVSYTVLGSVPPKAAEAAASGL